MQFYAPTSVEEAINTLSQASPPVKILAGGTDLLVQLRAGVIQPGSIVDIKKIPATHEVSISEQGTYIGASISGAEFTEHPELPAMWPGVAEAFDIIGSTQVQGRATLAGNLCNASPAADSVPAMIAAGAIAIVAGPEGQREVAVEDIPASPGKTTLAANEFIVAFKLPNRAKRSGDAYLRMTPRSEMDIAIVGLGVNITLDTDGVCIAARVGLGAVAATALKVDAAAEALIGTTVHSAAIEKMQAAVRAACHPIDDKRGTIEYRIHIAGVLAKRAVEIALKRANANQ
ncbi:FAD binding domain-containing protein [Aurantivibrio plasticivorans]